MPSDAVEGLTREDVLGTTVKSSAGHWYEVTETDNGGRLDLVAVDSDNVGHTMDADDLLDRLNDGEWETVYEGTTREIVTDGGHNQCSNCGSHLPEEIDEGTGVYCPDCGLGQLVTDGGWNVDGEAPPRGCDHPEPAVLEDDHAWDLVKGVMLVRGTCTSCGRDVEETYHISRESVSDEPVALTDGGDRT
ncbi:hypothetical protein C453_12846 [Haloferax elongans ATCC BAA-1513]|uniref:Uncharacterized protein n=1 Tax=Haloferax elongans ATCC BAA-1513 TaxID=1230453 RepID=M0HMV3_HALEO|nr:hypothetical protein [Haloferax elongans]ELZ84434.1 hypothetical protein C453_12846 [Haloferax elongans ATCC BAA-1513]